MASGVEVALVAGGFTVLGVTIGALSSFLVARIGFRAAIAATTAASGDVRAQIEAASADIRGQIEADRRNRLWEKQAAVYVEAIEAVHHWQVRRQQEVQWTPLSDEKRQRIQATLAALREPDWNGLEARLQAFASKPVFTAMQESNQAESYVIDRFKMWQDSDSMVMAHPTEQNRKFREVNFNSLWKASIAAEGATNHVIEVIRTELQNSGPPLGNRTYTELDRLRDHLPKDPGIGPATPPEA